MLGGMCGLGGIEGWLFALMRLGCWWREGGWSSSLGDGCRRLGGWFGVGVYGGGEDGVFEGCEKGGLEVWVGVSSGCAKRDT